ncbi:MAG: acyltransferase [Crocinitomicaceae bacterium]|nr:acyltransferase [Crocinitomicaceae bacterium]
MRYYKKNFQGDLVENLRISNSTFIDNRDKLVLKSNTYIGHYNFLEASNAIFIDRGCQITSYVSISTHSSHQSIRLYGSNFGDVEKHIGYLTGEVRIGEFTFVGPHVVIMPNTKIGKGCIVKAFSYVKGEFPDYSIIEGNPARVVGDVRESDHSFLSDHPELNNSYMK